MPSLGQPRVTTQAELTDVSTPHVAADIETDAIETAKILDDAVTLGKMDSGTPGQFIGYDVGGDPAELDAGGLVPISSHSGSGVSGHQSIALPADKRGVVVVLRVKSLASPNNLLMRVNGDAGNNYSYQTISATGTTAGAAGANAATISEPREGVNQETCIKIELSTLETLGVHDIGLTGGITVAGVLRHIGMTWTADAKITSISVDNSGGNFDYNAEVFAYNE